MTECSLDTKRLWVVIATVVINVVAVSLLTLAQYQSKHAARQLEIRSPNASGNEASGHY
ncbi:MAG TPA: hypothetical protein VLI42_10330 [Chthoniobacterales bacterium]|nr:hypothetical protein [Chthoniobacterales bacterium]